MGQRATAPWQRLRVRVWGKRPRRWCPERWHAKGVMNICSSISQPMSQRRLNTSLCQQPALSPHPNPSPSQELLFGTPPSPVAKRLQEHSPLQG